jgi:prepilin-type N-terminal cleavage/methylation domain-containing protein
MIHSKNKNGFTLIETLIALSMMAMVLTPIFVSQSNIMVTLGMFRNRFRRINIAKNFMVHAQRNNLEDKVTPPDTIDDPPTKFIYTREKASGPIAKQFKDVYKEVVRIEWKDDGIVRQDALVSFVFKSENQTEQPHE